MKTNLTNAASSVYTWGKPSSQIRRWYSYDPVNGRHSHHFHSTCVHLQYQPLSRIRGLIQYSESYGNSPRPESFQPTLCTLAHEHFGKTPRKASTIGMSGDRATWRTLSKPSSRPSKSKAPRTTSPHEQRNPAVSKSGGRTVLLEAESAMESATLKNTHDDRTGHHSGIREAPGRTKWTASAANAKLNDVRSRPESGGSDDTPATPTRNIVREVSTPAVRRSYRRKSSQTEKAASSENIRIKNKHGFVERHTPSNKIMQTRERSNEAENDKDLTRSGESTREEPSLVDADSPDGYPGINTTLDEFPSPGGLIIIIVESICNATRDVDDGDVQLNHSNYEKSLQWDHSPVQSDAHAASRRAFETLHCRAADRFRETGVHSFNMSFEDLREMAQAHVSELAKKQRPQSAQDLRELFAFALTNSNYLLEENAVADARLKLQATRNAAYGIRLKERMTTLRLYAARASRQPRGIIVELAGLVRKAQTELQIADEAVQADVEEVKASQNALGALTGDCQRYIRSWC